MGVDFEERHRSMTAYREPGRDLDLTEIEIAKIHEEGETKRKLIEERETTKRTSIKEVGYTPHVALCIVGILVTIGGTIVGGMWIDARRPAPPCVETSTLKSGFYKVDCPHPMHVLSQDEKTWTCKCGTPTVKP